jgi:uncharacterized repeat protein (TIGR02543 family)
MMQEETAMHTQRKFRPGRFPRFAGLLGAAIVFASCLAPVVPSNAGSTAAGNAGSLSIDLKASLAGQATPANRAVVADFTKIATKAVVTVTGGDGVSQTQTITNLAATTVTIGGIAVGSACTASIAVFKGETQIGSGSATFALSPGATASVAVPVSYGKTGSGGYSIALSWPAASADYASATLNGAAIAQPAISNDGTTCSATFAGSGVASGSYTLLVTFRSGGAGGKAVGFITEAVNVWDGQTSSCWLDPNGNIKPTREVTASELFSSTASLAGIAVTGLATGQSFAFAPDTGTYDNLLVTGTYIGFTPVEGLHGQTISYSWSDGATTPTVTQLNSGAYCELTLGTTDTYGKNTLTVTVTAPDGATQKTCTLNFYKAYTVRFNLNEGAIGPATSIAARVIGKNRTTTNPGTPARSTFTFGGWYADSAFAAPWDFASSTVTADTTLYAKWTGTNGTTIGVPDNSGRTLAIAIAPYAATSPQWTKVTVEPAGTDEASFKAVSSGWVWHLDGVLDPDQTGPVYIINEYTTGGMIGAHRISATVKSGTITYSAETTVTIEAAGGTLTIPGGNYTASSFTTMVGANMSGTTVLSNDITITDSWTTPLGALSGKFNGGGHTITFANGGTTGLFTSVSGGTVANVDVAAGTLTITAGTKGVIADTMTAGTIYGCSTSGTVNASGQSKTGGLLGTMSGGTLSNCTSTAAITNQFQCGGLVGEILIPSGDPRPTIVDCSHTVGSISSTQDYAGGLIGFNGSGTEDGANLTNCFNLSNVTGRSSVGGLCGTLYGSAVSGCYARGTVTMNSDSTGCNVGGLFALVGRAAVEYCYFAGTVKNVGIGLYAGGISACAAGPTSFTYCYAQGTVTGASAGAGFNSKDDGLSTTLTNCYAAMTVSIGTNGFLKEYSNKTLVNCYYDKTMTAADGSGSTATGLVTANMKLSSSFVGWDFDTVWAIDPSGVINGGYPYLRRFGEGTVTP